MAITINLLPDLHQAKLKAKRYRQLAVGSSIVVCSASLGIVLVLFIAVQAQNVQMDRLKNSIQEKEAIWVGTPNLQKILTTQQNLVFLPQLYKERAYMTKFLNLLGSVSPKDIALQSLDLDSANTLKVIGRSRNYAAATKFAKALEASNVTLGPGAGRDNLPNFSNINLGALATATDGKVDFTLSASLSPGVIRGE